MSLIVSLIMSLISRYEDTERRRDALIEQINQFMIRHRKTEHFIGSVKDLQKLIIDSDKNLWSGIVSSMTVYRKDRITFGLACGMETEA